MTSNISRMSSSLSSLFRCSALFVSFVALCAFVGEIAAVGEVIWAVNCGGEAHVDVYGIHYQKDWLKVGYASAHGRNIAIRRIHPQDQVLYQTERYHTSSFAYDVPVKDDGDYVLVLKFSEVWFTEPNQKVFSIRLNEEHTVVEHLDIFAVAGFGMAHDEVIPFSVRRGKLYIGSETSKFDGTLHVEFVKLHQDNPKINAMLVMRGKPEDAPRLPPLPTAADYGHQEADETDEEESESTSSDNSKPRHRRGAEPRIVDPYAADDPSSMLVPVAAAIGIFIPIVFCLCKL